MPTITTRLHYLLYRLYREQPDLVAETLAEVGVGMITEDSQASEKAFAAADMLTLDFEARVQADTLGPLNAGDVVKITVGRGMSPERISGIMESARRALPDGVRIVAVTDDISLEVTRPALGIEHGTPMPTTLGEEPS